MTWKAEYYSPTAGTYWLTIRADSLNQASYLAERNCRKGFIMKKVFTYDHTAD